jgi:hypothetical protein
MAKNVAAAGYSALPDPSGGLTTTGPFSVFTFVAETCAGISTRYFHKEEA